ncbi:zinc finger CCHC domain-containing protein 8 homolog [Episyrphus balteatus]|uniref:zinc finger CCHC domain-containing protein 8 homolog n=1 Tax=Episyrphus balteatus TaxID=286459 RepID=UPI002484DA0E|nr:zinc finger CCHC domain-containing protein 8 homolog [Episyrphus balteatus]
MGSKRPTNTEQIILSDSDCEIQEVDIKSITIPDSPTLATDLTIDDNEQAELTNISEFNEDNLLFEVNFKNERLFNEHKDLVVEGLSGFLKDKGYLVVEDDTKIQVFRESGKESVVEIEQPLGDVKTKIKTPEPVDDVKPGSDDEDMDIAGLFMIDTQPAEKVDAVQIPSYKRTIKEILNESSAQKKKKNEDECERPKQKKSCFNCDGIDHDLRTCPKPRNNTKINKAKKSMNLRRDRYHVDIEQRFAHLRPGQVSKQLREALGIRNGELPFFFYRMRLLGYPPGWLEDARVAHSGISLFDSEGRSVQDPEDEEGEVDNEKHKYDINKIIAFPGFNTDPGPNFYDDYKHHNVPPINEEDCKEKFIQMLGANVVKGYKRKKLKHLPEGETPEKNTMELSEMEIEDEENASIANVEFTRPPPPSTPPKDGDEPAPPPPPPPPESPQNVSTRTPSPTLEDLEQKQKLLRELLQSSTITISDNDDSLIDEVLELEAETSGISITSTPNNSIAKIKLPDELSESTNSPLVINSETDTQESVVTPQTPLAMESVLGTPLLKFSPFDKLPCGDNFKVGVSDVINFENLPDSTGTYEKMKGVIKKVRTIVTKLNSEDS